MKKLKLTFTGLLLVCLGLGVASAQANTTAGTPMKQAPAKKTTKKPAMTKAAPTAKAAAKPAAAKSAGPHMKKDGTPDKRYKENKTPKAGGSTTPKAAPKKATPKKAAAPAANKPM
jgi:hypothetical protein